MEWEDEDCPALLDTQVESIDTHEDPLESNACVGLGGLSGAPGLPGFKGQAGQSGMFVQSLLDRWFEPFVLNAGLPGGPGAPGDRVSESSMARLMLINFRYE